MDTIRSTVKAQDFLAKGSGLLRTERIHSGIIKAEPGLIFPLLCPTREYDWIPGWECDLLFTQSGYAEYGAVFKTRDPMGKKVWICDTFEPDTRIGYVNQCESLLTRLLITLERERSGTLVTFTFAFMALNENGNRFVEHYPAKKEDPHRFILTQIADYLKQES